MSLLRTVVIIVSDTAAADPTTDRSGDVLKQAFAADAAGKFEEPSVEIVPDDISQIQRAIRRWTDGENRANLIVTTGGTGFAVKDFTPEAVSPLLDREAPGLVHAMLRTSFEVTPFAMMSRPVAGVRRKTIIITLPGSPKGAKENLQAVLKLLPHACMQAAGEDSRTAHAGGVKKLERDAGVSATSAGGHSHSHSHTHDHHHDHSHGGHKAPKPRTDPSQRPQSNDPALGATARARSSPYPMLTVTDAVSTILSKSPAPIPVSHPLTPDIVGAVISSDIAASEAVPAYRASIVDGYAVIVPSDKTKLKGTFPVASVSHAQASSMPPPLQEGQIARITTGAPLPEGADAVVMVEDTVVASTTEDRKEEATVEILTDALEKGENVREPGSDISLGSVILRKGQRISAIGGEVGVLAAAGIKDVPTYRRPRVGVMSTGDEVTDISFPGELQGGMIRDSNRPSLLSLIRGWGLCEEVLDLGVARDTPEGELERRLRDALRTADVDVLVTTGGVSMGELDLLKPTVERAMGGTVHFGRVSMKPGKPTTFASVPFKGTADGARSERLLFGLPGNPASAIVTANLFLLPCLQKMSGLQEGGRGLERVLVTLAEKVRCDKARVEYHRVVVSGARDGALVARSTGMQRSSRVGSLASANALLELPQREGVLEAGEKCEALMMGPVLGFGGQTAL
ncbi:uncharacterized protein HMPREF1541_03637 [Cyphellophora europaea CBS 101466]|uniref:MoaB/Mog domain-containing protein n=1 Tax=Cyphellophora europaea (strain CBS 101466) TaxID=1220924 RepID=W2RYW5_CYPE1|nr:uncharacterized protein HMPREF1541_03637 [Cyphellophora europaea CBS 101466]ETN41701.1 hypothetical protein HMPREF1541_03637 [Cyphellophora europaea CBS 101466]